MRRESSRYHIRFTYTLGEFLPLRVIESLGHSRLYEINTDEHIIIIIIIIIIIVIMSHYLYNHNAIALTSPKTPCSIDHMTNQKSTRTRFFISLEGNYSKIKIKMSAFV